MHLNRMPPIYIEAIRAKGGYFELEIVFQDHNHSEVSADGIGARKDSLDLFRSGIGCHIEIFGRGTADEIPHTATGEVGNVTTVAQPSNDARRDLFHVCGL